MMQALAQPTPERIEQARQVIERAAVERTHHGGGVGEYLASLLRRIAESLSLPDLPLGSIGVLGKIITWTVILGALTAIVLLLWSAFNSRRRRSSSEVVAPATPERSQRPTSAEQWAQRVESDLAHEDAASAIEALWWWARATAIEDSDDAAEPTNRALAARPASWGARSLIEHLSRAVAPQLLILERFTYGPLTPRVEQLRDLWRELRRAVAGAPTAPSEEATP